MGGPGRICGRPAIAYMYVHASPRRSSSGRRKDGIVLLDAGEYLHCPEECGVPLILTPRDLAEGLLALRVESGLEARSPRAPSALHLTGARGGLGSLFRASSSLGPLSPLARENSNVQRSNRVMRLYQLLVGGMATRGRVFGTKVSLSGEWLTVDPPYFGATGARGLCGAENPTTLVLTWLCSY